MAQREGKGTCGKHPKRAWKLREKALKVIEKLGKLYPKARLELEYGNAFELLIEAILAAQESDKKINQLREELFKKYRTPEDVIKASLDELERDISSVNFYRRKAKLIKKCCQVLVEKFGGKVPKSVDEMTKLPGVGRKTANMVIGGAFDLPAIIVDRHVLRVAQRIGFTSQKDADKAEKELMEIVPKEYWTRFSFLLLNHGKNICLARNPECERCPICELCDYCRVKI